MDYNKLEIIYNGRKIDIKTLYLKAMQNEVEIEQYDVCEAKKLDEVYMLVTKILANISRQIAYARYNEKIISEQHFYRLVSKDKERYKSYFIE